MKKVLICRFWPQWRLLGRKRAKLILKMNSAMKNTDKSMISLLQNLNSEFRHPKIFLYPTVRLVTAREFIFTATKSAPSQGLALAGAGCGMTGIPDAGNSSFSGPCISTSLWNLGCGCSWWDWTTKMSKDEGAN